MSASNVLGMQELGNVTSADIVAYATCEQAAPGKVRITEFADGEGLTPDGQEHAVTRMGIDGKFVYGIVFRAAQVTLNLLPTSPFLKIVENCVGIQRSTRKGLKWTMEVTYPATGKVTTFREGILVNSPPLPAAQDTQGNVSVVIQFGEFDTQSI